MGIFCVLINHCIVFYMQCNTCTVRHAVSTVIRIWVYCIKSLALLCGSWVKPKMHNFVNVSRTGGMYKSPYCNFQFAVFIDKHYHFFSQWKLVLWMFLLADLKLVCWVALCILLGRGQGTGYLYVVRMTWLFECL